MFRFRLLLVLTGLLAPRPASHAYSADWPMWRHDVVRSGATDEELPAKLHLQWTRQLLAPMPAWPNEARLHFDASYEPVVLGSRMFVGSMVDGSLTAFDTATGKELWRFYTNGPVRLAPVAFDGQVCFGSDDGWLYNVDAETGKLRWKVSGAPEDRESYRHLGNARLISFWPVRGGPVVADGVVYFGAGIWPTLGVFVRAVDAKTGKILWTNDDSHSIENVRVDHNYVQESGISPQGHMLIQGDMLIVPNGRSMPARLDRKSGKLHYFVQGYRNGDSRVVVNGDIALVGLTGVVSLKDGREIASRWLAAGKYAPEGWSSPKVDLFEGPLFPYRFQPACDYRSAIDQDMAFGVDDGIVYVYDLKNAATTLQDKDFNGNAIKPARWDAPLLWSLKTDFARKKLRTTTVLKAGNRLYSHSGRNLFAVTLEAGVKKAGLVNWTAELPAEPASLLAADGRLFVVTEDGSIHCFGGEAVEPVRHSLAKSTDESAADDWSKIAESVFDAAGKEGYAIVAGLKSGRLVEELLRNGQHHVIAIDGDAGLVDKLRRQFGTDERFRGRFQALVDEDPASVRLPPYIAGLIATEDSQKLKLDLAPRLLTLYDSLRPYGGVMCIPKDDPGSDRILQSVSPGHFAGVKTDSTDRLITIRRTGPLPGSSIWSHESGDAARSFYSRDDLVQAPLAVLWYGDGRDHGFYKRKDYGHGLKPQVAGGRLFALQVATNSLKSVDAYTGRLLWSRTLGGSARYASMPDAVYVADERTCLVLDPATGEPKHTFGFDVDQPADTPVSATDIRVGEDVILIAVRFNKENAISKGRWNSELIIALDRTSGKQLWSRPAELRYNTAAIAVSGGRVFCIDSHSPEEVGAMRRRGRELKTLPSTILALDARTGSEVWKVVKEDPPAVLTSLHFMSMRTQDDWLAYSVDQDLLLGGKANQTFALSGETGQEVWQKPVRGQQPLILGPETFINQTGHTWKVSTGEVVSGSALFRRGGCNYAVGGKNLLFLRSNCATYVDVNTKQEYAIRNLRSGCSNSLVAADGLLNAPCFSVGCVCNYPIQTSFAMFHMPQSAAWHGVSPLKQQDKARSE
ncbi:MAG: PQQ-binding-like beta-propeller repeat protein [Planctomycetota bacterium]|nr:PQQ-binding-like beta-propeller repeat protein [Planctomycetota bacterium]MDA1252711.1 PQQ-binding-like beta-propeller repeat protein [Planctomycetota bacterium]